jgi:hypothetical protein
MARLRGRTRELVERRQSLARLLITLFVARIATTVVEIVESHLTWWSLLITLAIGIEAWRAWTVLRAARRDPDAPAPAPLPDSAWDRMLRPVERYGPAVLIVLTIAYIAAVVVLAVDGTSREHLLDAGVIGREATTFFFLFIVVAGYASLRGVPRADADPSAPTPG